MSDRYDIVVVGGGIHGVGVAQAAAARGYSVLLLEERGLAAGTSSRSSKLIHGGLRYLESGQIGLVRECLRERAILLRIAPDLVRLVPFHFPVYATTRRRPWKVRAGLSLYALLGGLDHAARFERLARRRWDELDGLRTDGLEAVYRYRDALTDDAALTRAVMGSAESLGAIMIAPARFHGATFEDDAAAEGGACRIDYIEGGGEGEARRESTCRARVLVNAAGPWVSEVTERIHGHPAPPPIELVQGAHIEVAGALDGGIYYVEAPNDGRAVFAIPWKGRTLVGTTETPYRGDPAAVTPLVEEQAYLAGVLTHYFPRFDALAPDAIVGATAGLRVLPAGGGRAFERSRETLLEVDRDERPRVLTIYGGKLTAYRATAEKVFRRLEGSLPTRRAIADTRQLRLVAS